MVMAVIERPNRDSNSGRRLRHRPSFPPRNNDASVLCTHDVCTDAKLMSRQLHQECVRVCLLAGLCMCSRFSRDTRRDEEIEG